MHFTYVIFGIFLFINTLQLKAESQNISSEWVQAQSYISSWKTSKKSQPLFSINETGHFRPYTVENDKLKPIFDDKITKDIQDYDLYSPKSLPSGNLVLVGAENGKKNFDIFVYHRQKRELVNITSSPEIDEGSVCVDSKEEQFLYHTERTGVLVKYDTKSGKIISVKLPLVSWKSCHWINNKEILIVGGRAKQYFSQHCMESPKGWKCDNLKILNQFDAIGDMSSSSQNEIFLHARKSNEQFRKPYRWNPKTDEFDTVPINFPVGDIASFSGTTYRVGLHSFFSFNASADHGKIVLFSQEIEGQTWGIIADGKHPKRPAQLRDGKWEYLAGLNDLNSKEVDILPQEVWIRSKKGKLYQAFLWSKEQPKQIVVWTHGGPTESVSPRFNPYFAALLRAGWGVLAINYPGSTGRGAEYEGSFSKESLVDCYSAVSDYLELLGVEKIVSWAISTGAVVMRGILPSVKRWSGIIDQAGFDNTTLREFSTNNKIPLFSVRGKFDSYGKTNKIDYFYFGGHDILQESEFKKMFENALKFLKTAQPLTPQNDSKSSAQILLDPGHTGSENDPNIVNGIKEADLTFELAHHLATDCLNNYDIAFTRTGSAIPLSINQNLDHIVKMQKKLNAVPFLSLHFNAKFEGFDGKNSASVFIPSGKSIQKYEIDVAKSFIEELKKINLPPVENYPNLTNISGFSKIAPGVFQRGLKVLMSRRNGPSLLLETAFYDDEKENILLSKKSLEKDGTWSRPRILDFSRTICPTVQKLVQFKQ